MKRKLAVLLMTAVTASALLAGCGNQAGEAGGTTDNTQEAADSTQEAADSTQEAADSTQEAADTNTGSEAGSEADSADTQTESDASGEKVVLKAVCDLTPDRKSVV